MSERIETAALRDFSVSLCRAAGLSADDAALLTDSILFAAPVLYLLLRAAVTGGRSAITASSSPGR